jgi:AcrR family transcriptional regulator
MSAVPSSQQRWRRRKEARPQEILDAALSVFAEKGYAATRMEDIAVRAGLTKGTIYLYFDGKEAVFKSLVRASIGDIIAQVAASASAFEGPMRDLLRFALTMMGRLIVSGERFALAKIILAESGNFPELAKFYRFEIIAKGLATLSGLIERGIARGEFRAMNPEHAARLCVAPLLLSGLWRMTFEKLDSEPYDHESFVQAHIENLLRGFRPDGATS